mmetsp:Transcript_21094/g.23445  ORF Transcript_21094/g.23445 Transcript_21094/m.23445 type:complete len:271 (+) Transcript_21094:88-900(+)
MVLYFPKQALSTNDKKGTTEGGKKAKKQKRKKDVESEPSSPLFSGNLILSKAPLSTNQILEKALLYCTGSQHSSSISSIIDKEFYQHQQKMPSLNSDYKKQHQNGNSNESHLLKQAVLSPSQSFTENNVKLEKQQQRYASNIEEVQYNHEELPILEINIVTLNDMQKDKQPHLYPHYDIVEEFDIVEEPPCNEFFSPFHDISMTTKSTAGQYQQFPTIQDITHSSFDRNDQLIRETDHPFIIAGDGVIVEADTVDIDWNIPTVNAKVSFT